MKPLINIFKKLDFYQTFYGSYFSKSFLQEKINAIWLFSLLGTFLFYPDTIYPRIKMQLKGKKVQLFKEVTMFAPNFKNITNLAGNLSTFHYFGHFGKYFGYYE